MHATMELDSVCIIVSADLMFCTFQLFFEAQHCAFIATTNTRQKGAGALPLMEICLSLRFVLHVHAVPAANGDQEQQSLSQRSPAVLAAPTQNRGSSWADTWAEGYHSQGGPRQCNLLHCL